MAHAQQWTDFTPVKSEERSASSAAADLPDAVRVRIQQNGETLEQWVPGGWQIAIPTAPNKTMIAYGWEAIGLPIGLQLLAFELKRNEWTDSPAGYKCDLQTDTADTEHTT